MRWGLYAAGWTLGWLLLWSGRRLPSSSGATRGAIAAVVAARDEAPTLPALLTGVLPQLRPGDELVVVDDHSTDATAAVAGEAGATVVVAPPLPPGWVGKPHACMTGAATTTAETLVFLDADVRPGPQLLDGLAAALAADPDAVVSVLPWHAGERLVALAAVVALMGSGGFTVLGGRLATDVAFGPVLAVRRVAYDRVGGHANPDVRASLTEDIALARAVGCSRLFSDRRDATARRDGFRQSFASWSRTMGAGVAATRWWLLLAAVAWVWSLAGAPFTGWLAYALSALQVWVLGRRAGRLGPLLAAVYPVVVVVLVAIVVDAGRLRLRGTTTWRGRRVSARGG